ncbi:MAG: redoxin family protein [Vicinamibacterales bacterium]
MFDRSRGVCSFALIALLVSMSVDAAPAVVVETLAGRKRDPLKLAPSVAAEVFVFVSVDCAISRRYAPELRRLQRAFAQKGVHFTLVYPNPAELPAVIRAHSAAYGVVDAVRDPTQAFTRHVGATVTPEVAVIAANGRLAYRGRIDNRYAALGLERRATQHDLAMALTRLLEGRVVHESRTPVVGHWIAALAPGRRVGRGSPHPR